MAPDPCPTDPDPTEPVAVLRRESRSFVQRLRLWTPARYVAAAPRWRDGDPGTRGDLVHHLAQWLADRAAEVDGGPRRALPRLDSDLGLADQLAVTADDLVRSLDRADPAGADPAGADPAAWELAVAATAHLLAHRADLLEDDVPAGLAAALGLSDVVGSGRAACRREVGTTRGPK